MIRKAKIEETIAGVRLSYSNEDGRRIVREFYAPLNGGYVREGDGKQVCDGLYSTGNTLEWSGRRPLVRLIRQEWRAHQRSERKAARS